MAAKLMQRCYRLFGISSPLCIHTNAMCAGSKMVISRAPSQIPFASLRIPSFVGRTDKLSVHEQEYRAPPNREELEGLIGSASTTEDLLNLGELHPLTANQAALIITRLSRVVVGQKLDPGSVLEDARFQHLLQTVHMQISQVWNTALVNLLKSLSWLGLEQRRVRSVEQEVRWRLKRLPFKQLASLADHLAAGIRGDEQNELLSDLLKQLELRWTEIDDTRTVVMLIAKVGAFSPALMDRLEDKISQVWNTALVNLLKSLSWLGLEQRRVRSVEQEVRWRLKRLPFKQLAYLADHLAAGIRGEEQNELLSDLLKQLELRWTEIDDTRTVVMLIAKVGSFSPALMDRLEDKALELAEQFSPEDTRKIAMALAFQNRRSVPLLRAISYHLVQKHFTLSTNVLLDVAFAYGKLNFHQTQVFQKIASDLHPHVAKMAHWDVVRCLKSFAFLKWLNLPLFEAFAQYTVDNADRFEPVLLSNVVLAFARLNFQPSCAEAFFSVIHERLGAHLDSLDPYLLVDLVWSLCVLQQAKSLHLQKVLAPEFRTRFLGDQSPKGHNYRLKVIHINSTARLECTGYVGPLLPQEALDLRELHGERKATPLQSGLKETLKSVAGKEDKARFEVDTVFGWQLDAEMVLDGDNQALPVAIFEAPHLLQSKGSKPLPPGAKRLAFLRWEFPNFSNRSKDLLGRFVMARRHLQAAGFLLVDVPYYEWFDLKSEWQKAAFLRDKMNKAVAEEMAK